MFADEEDFDIDSFFDNKDNESEKVDNELTGIDEIRPSSFLVEPNTSTFNNEANQTQISNIISFDEHTNVINTNQYFINSNQNPAKYIPSGPAFRKNKNLDIDEEVVKTQIELKEKLNRTLALFHLPHWIQMCKELPLISQVPNMFSICNIQSIKENVKKLPFLATMITNIEIVTCSGPYFNTTLTLVDPTGTIKAHVQSDVYKMLMTQLVPYSVVVLNDINVHSIGLDEFFLVVTKSSLFKIYPPKMVIENPKNIIEASQNNLFCSQTQNKQYKNTQNNTFCSKSENKGYKATQNNLFCSQTQNKGYQAAENHLFFLQTQNKGYKATENNLFCSQSQTDIYKATQNSFFCSQNQNKAFEASQNTPFCFQTQDNAHQASQNDLMGSQIQNKQHNINFAKDNDVIFAKPRYNERLSFSKQKQKLIDMENNHSKLNSTCKKQLFDTNKENSNMQHTNNNIAQNSRMNTNSLKDGINIENIHKQNMNIAQNNITIPNLIKDKTVVNLPIQRKPSSIFENIDDFTFDEIVSNASDSTINSKEIKNLQTFIDEELLSQLSNKASQESTNKITVNCNETLKRDNLQENINDVSREEVVNTKLHCENKKRKQSTTETYNMSQNIFETGVNEDNDLDLLFTLSPNKSDLTLSSLHNTNNDLDYNKCNMSVIANKANNIDNNEPSPKKVRKNRFLDFKYKPREKKNNEIITNEQFQSNRIEITNMCLSQANSDITFTIGNSQISISDIRHKEDIEDIFSNVDTESLLGDF